MPAERYAEISRSLTRSTTVDAAVSRLDQNETAGLPEGLSAKLITTLLLVFTGLWVVLLFWRLVDGPRGTSAVHFSAWLKGKDLKSSELWEFDSGSECGYALLNDGVVVDFWLYYDYQATECDG